LIYPNDIEGDPDRHLTPIRPPCRKILTTDQRGVVLSILTTPPGGLCGDMVTDLGSSERRNMVLGHRHAYDGPAGVQTVTSYDTGRSAILELRPRGSSGEML